MTFMTDLTLEAYGDVSEEELRQILKEEARKICGPHAFENNFPLTDDDMYSFLNPQLEKPKTLPRPLSLEQAKISSKKNNS